MATGGDIKLVIQVVNHARRQLVQARWDLRRARRALEETPSRPSDAETPPAADVTVEAERP